MTIEAVIVDTAAIKQARLEAEQAARRRLEEERRARELQERREREAEAERQRQIEEARQKAGVVRLADMLKEREEAETLAQSDGEDAAPVQGATEGPSANAPR